jgi:hypothetical protein
MSQERENQITQKLKAIVALGFEPKTSWQKQGGATITAHRLTC